MVGRPKHHYLQLVYEGNKLVESKLKPYKHSGEREIKIFPK